MGIYYYAVDYARKEYFSAPEDFSIKSPGIFHPKNPFPNMVVMMNSKGCSFDIVDDCGHDIPPSDDFVNITSKVYQELLRIFPKDDEK